MRHRPTTRNKGGVTATYTNAFMPEAVAHRAVRLAGHTNRESVLMAE
jgi:hypothetical protein